MKKIYMKVTALMLAVIIISSTTGVVSAFSDIAGSASYKGAVDRLASMGIISGNEKGEFNPDGLLTREQFSRIIVVAAGLEDTAKMLKGSTIFPDVNPNGWSAGYINAALREGYIAGAPNGNFYPTDSITFAQICTILVRALGYNDQDVPGLWPKNYIEKAKNIGLTEGIDLQNGDSVPRWAAAIMVDRLLNTNVKKNNPSDADRAFSENVGYYMKCIILGNSLTSDSLDKKQILTDKGILYNPSEIKLDLGNEYNLVIENDTILKASGKLNSTKEITIDVTSENKVSYRTENSYESMLLTDNIIYYYKGQKQEYSDIKNLLQKNVSIVLADNQNKAGYKYAVIFDPVYSKPEIALNFSFTSKRLGSIRFEDDAVIMREGELIDISQIENKDVVYQISDIWGIHKYHLVINNKVGGRITDIIPNRLAPTALQIDGVNYEFSKNIEISKITNSYGTFTIGNNLILYLGHDGKIVNLEYFGSEENSNYAVVLDAGYSVTTELDGRKNYIYNAKVLFDTGMSATYDVTSNPHELKGKLVKYKFIDEDTLALEQIPYNFPGEVYIKKDERMIDDSYVADNTKIFNIVYDSGTIEAEVLQWKDLPGGVISGGKIWFLNKVGVFEDINVIFTNNILDERYKTSVIKSLGVSHSDRGTSYDYTFLIDGKEYKYNKYIEGAGTGSVYMVEMSAEGIASIVQGRNPNVKGRNVQAIDAKRIKINNKVYWFKDSISVYFKDFKGAFTVKTLADIDLNQTYGQVAMYFDKSGTTGGKVEAIILYE